jgi:hypothetical protein
MAKVKVTYMVVYVSPQEFDNLGRNMAYEVLRGLGLGLSRPHCR